jgi:hypothetical protein
MLRPQQAGFCALRADRILFATVYVVHIAVHESANGTKRTYRDDLLFVRFRATADRHARVAWTASVVNDPERT